MSSSPSQRPREGPWASEETDTSGMTSHIRLVVVVVVVIVVVVVVVMGCMWTSPLQQMI